MGNLENGKEIKVKPEEMIVSSTDVKGNIIYANDVFCDVAGYTRDEVMGKPHNIIRHEDMPKVVFKILWDAVLDGKIVDAFVKNKKSNGDYYWVKATVIPTVKNGKVTQITSYRKPLNSFAKDYVIDLYAKLVEYEEHNSVDESLSFVLQYLEDRGLTYQQFIDRLSQSKGVDIVNIIDEVKFKNAHIIFKAHILNAVKHNHEDIEVTSSDMCELGRVLIKLENESFTKKNEWKKLVEHHEHVHTTLHKYVDKAKDGASVSELNKIISTVDDDTNAIFGNLTKLVDGYKG